MPLPEEQFERVRETVRGQMGQALERDVALQAEIEAAIEPIEKDDGEARATLEKMDRASAKTPLGLLAYRYAKGMVNARGPVVFRDGSLSEEYEELSEAEIEKLKARFAEPARQAVSVCL